MIFNTHLLKKELSVSEYEEVIPIKAVSHKIRWQRLPKYIIARCPFCDTPNSEIVDTYSLRRWYGIMAHGGAVSLSVFHFDFFQHCKHFALVQKSFSISEVPEEAKGRAITEDTVPYVIGHLLENNLCQAVIHALPVCRIEGNQFVPSYSLMMISYFSQQPPEDVYRAVHRYNGRYYDSWESSTYLYLPLGLGEPHWADLPRWVAAGQLYWVDGNDPDLMTHTSDIARFPYKAIDLGGEDPW